VPRGVLPSDHPLPYGLARRRFDKPLEVLLGRLGIEVTDAGSASEYSFGSFRLLPDQQLLLEGDKSVRLSSRAREILVALLERPGVLVSKEELFPASISDRRPTGAAS